MADTINQKDMKIIKYLWRIVVNIVTLVIVFSIFSLASTHFETATFAILVLIYLAVTGFGSAWAITHIEFSGALDKRFDEIERLLDKDYKDAIGQFNKSNDLSDKRLPQQIAEDYGRDIMEEKKEARKEAAEVKKSIMIKFYINAAFQTVIYITALFNLISAFN